MQQPAVFAQPLTTGPSGQYVLVSAPERNGLGTFGFLTALVGIFIPTGVVAFLGLVICLAALGRSPRALAGIGVVIALLGSLLWLVIDVLVLVAGLVAVVAGLAVAGAAFALTQPEVVEVTSDMVNVTIATRQYEKDRQRLPESLADLGLGVSTLTDPWGASYVYRPAEGKLGFDLISPGPDLVLGTNDDLALSGLGDVWEDALERFEDEVDDLGERLEAFETHQPRAVPAGSGQVGGWGWRERLERYEARAAHAARADGGPAAPEAAAPSR